MATKLGRKALPPGCNPADFKYKGRPANDQGDFGPDVGIADAVCVNQFGDTEESTKNANKYYHGGVVQSGDGRWWVYLEWGRIKAGNSWNGSFAGGDFMFVECSGEDDARAFFAKQLKSKNTGRLEQKSIAGKAIWAAKEGDDGYLIQRLATRTRGLPDAYGIKDGSGVAPATSAAAPTKGKRDAAVTSGASAAPPAAPAKAFQPQVVALAKSLVGGTKDYARAASASTGITPTLAAIEEVRNDCIPTALKLLAKIGVDEKRQLGDSGLRDLSKYVASVVPRPIPHGGDPMSILLTSANILAIQQDLDAFESALSSEDFSSGPSAPSGGYDPDRVMNAALRWIDPNGDEGRWLAKTYTAMTNNRHGYLRGALKVLNAFAVERPDRDAAFIASVKRVAASRKGNFSLLANLQPKGRIDVGANGDLYGQSNVIFTQHGTRSVNIAPILQTHFRLPKQLSGVPIAGANFGHGNYQATDAKKAVGYSSYSGSIYGGGGGGVSGRGAFMFLNDMIMGDAYRAPSTGSWSTPPNGKDSVFGVGGDRGHRLENDEHVAFDPTYVRIRYLIEFGF